MVEKKRREAKPKIVEPAREAVDTKILEELIKIIRGEVNTSKIRVKDVVVGVFYAGVKLSTGHGGVAFTPVQEIPDAVCCPRSYGKMPNSGHLSDKTLDEVLMDSMSPGPLKSAVGVAAVNAISQKILFDGEYRKHEPIFGLDVIDAIEIRPADTVVMIGAFTPYIKRLEGKVKNLYVIERNPKAMVKGGTPLLSEELSKKLLPKADVVIASGSTVVNHTAGEILRLSKKAREVVLSGPTASMIPDPLFKRGVTAMGGVKINDTDRMLKVVSEAGSGYALLKECAIKMLFKK
ncbi:MAG: DUF364 domain-containing protein [Methanobacteriota archaeon]